MDLGLLLALALVALTLPWSVAGRRRSATQSPDPSRPGTPWPLALAALAAGAVFVAGLLLAFRFVHDDYATLSGGAPALFPAVDLRLIGVWLPFRLGFALGAPGWFFALANGGAIVAGSAALYRVLRGVDVDPATAALAAGVALLSPAFVPLARWGMGFQWLSALPAALLPLLALTAAAARHGVGDTRGRAAFLVLAAALAALAVRTKAPPMVVLPVAGWV